MIAPRYAIYFTPPEHSPLWRAGSTWLGRDAVSGAAVTQPDRLTGHGIQLQALTTTPRKYGFHATLKAPFRLATDVNEGDLMAALEQFAASFAPLRIHLGVDLLDTFVALLETRPDPAIGHLAEHCVRRLDGFRAPLTDEDRRRRGAHRLPPTQRALLERWGYPHVLEAFRFHMTLSDPLPEDHREPVRRAANDHFGPALADGVCIDAITLCRQTRPDAPFLQVRRYPFGRPRRRDGPAADVS